MKYVIGIIDFISNIFVSGPDTKEGVWDTIKTLFWAVMIAMFVRTFAYEPFSIPSGSMIPTLLVGDYLFVSKVSYGYSRHSFPFSLPLAPSVGRGLMDEPERGDVAVFKFPGDNRTDYIKRIIGLPGDEIQVKQGVLHINGAAVKRERIRDYTYMSRGSIRSASLYMETLPNGVSHQIIEHSDHLPMDMTGVYHVPQGHYFAMGDNRDNSRDSRYPDVGFVPAANLVGRAEVIFFSNDGSFWTFWNWPFSLRFDRFFSGVI